MGGVTVLKRNRSSHILGRLYSTYDRYTAKLNRYCARLEVLVLEPFWRDIEENGERMVDLGMIGERGRLEKVSCEDKSQE